MPGQKKGPDVLRSGKAENEDGQIDFMGKPYRKSKGGERPHYQSVAKEDPGETKD